MKKLFLASLALGGFMLTAQTAQAQAQSTAVSEDEARCFVSGVCKIDAEKKFSLTNISSAAPKPVAAAKAAAAAPAPKAAARRAPVRRGSSGVPARPAADRQSLDMRLSFELGSAQLTRDAMAQADIFAKVLKESSGSSGRFLIEGHTDSIGSREMNLDLSRKRAQSVVAYLVSHGVPASKLTPIGYGYAHPRDGLPASDPSNRRVEIVKN